MAVLVTGAGGFTGGHLVARLVREGESVRAMLRRAPAARFMSEITTGDVRDPAACARAVEGIDTVYHLAASYRDTGFGEADHMAANLHGTEHMYAAARNAGVRRFVYCSTVGVHGEIHGAAAAEDSPFAPTDPYQASKCAAEEYLQRQSSSMELVIFRPSGIYGPGDRRLLKFFRLIARGRFFMIGDGTPRYHLTYIDDLIEGILLCGRLPQAAGEVFILAGPHAPTLNEWAATVADVLGAAAPRLHLPVWPFMAAASVAERLCPLLGLTPPIFKRRMDFFTKNREFSIAKARTILGFAPSVQVHAGMERTAQWYREARLL
ncbi:NAD-dependent epimerase/dehydratase family protein [Candidatus Fermentibacteria bacterium]|nr:NAD-dependent epimerase/dehydratase family protein [Candidatus Fermentibacteria bacterium]